MYVQELTRTESVSRETQQFLGLVAQFGAFAPDIACLTSHLRQLLEKETPWVWLPEHKLNFENTKKALTSPTTLQPFDPKVKTVVLTDASRLHGIGFALVQVYKDRLALIPVSYTHLRAHETGRNLVCRLLLEKKK